MCVFVAERRKKPEEAEVAEESTPTEVEDQELQEQALGEFNDHVKSLVALFVQQELQDLVQRVTDLELLIAQPAGSLQLYSPELPPSPDVPEYNPAGTKATGGVPWYGAP